MKISVPILAILLALLISSCQSETKEAYASASVSALHAPAPIQYDKKKAYASAVVEEAIKEEEVYEAANEVEINLVDRKIIKNGDVRFETSDLKATRSQVLSQAIKLKAYIANDEENKYEGRITNSITLRVPSKKFEKLLSSTTEGVEKFDRKEIRAEDVTEEYVDLEARIKSKKELENRYFELLNKAKNIKEMLDIETQLGELRTEIESMQGRLRYMKNSVSYSTLNIEFYEDVAVTNKYGKQFAQGFKGGWDSLIGFFVSLIAGWPILIILGISLIYIRRVYKNRKKSLTQ